MAEYSKEQTEQVASIFLEQYNQENGTNFIWNDDKSYQSEEPYDFKLFDNKRELGIQLIRAVDDPDREFIRPGRSNLVIDPLIKDLEEANLPAIHVYLNFHNPPETKEDIKKAIYWLDFYIREKVSNSLGPVYFAYDPSFDDHYLPRITKYISHIRISPRKGPQGHVEMMFGWAREEPQSWTNDDKRVLNAAKKKETKYPEVILVIDSGHSPISDFCIPPIKDSLTKTELKEVWVVDNFATHRRAFRVK